MTTDAEIHASIVLSILGAFDRPEAEHWMRAAMDRDGVRGGAIGRELFERLPVVLASMPVCRPKGA